MTQLSTHAKPQTINSREVAEMLGKKHKELLRDIGTYTGYLTSADLRPLNFFAESSYVDAKGQTRPCYEVTVKGCEMIAHKMTGQKGVIFTAKYINRFHEMTEGSPAVIEGDSLKLKRLEIMERNAKAREENAKIKKAQELSKIAERTHVTRYRTILYMEAANTLAGKALLLPETAQRPEYDATTVADMVGLKSAMAVGKLANTLKMKAQEGGENQYGRWIHTKSKHSSKEVVSWVYFEEGVAFLKKHVEESRIG